jgi:DNA-binding NarL/FixJ family response regulator
MSEFAGELEPLGDLLAASLLAVRLPRGEAVALTARESELLDGLEEGLRFKQIARRLGISEATAKTHARNLFRKLDATSRAEAVHAAREHGLLA